jgi:hypothetical protein
MGVWVSGGISGGHINPAVRSSSSFDGALAPSHVDDCRLPSQWRLTAAFLGVKCPVRPRLRVMVQ